MTWWTIIKTYALVTVVSLLIWVWAEAESLSTVPVSPRVELARTDVVPTVLDAGWNGTVRMRVRGSSAAVSQAQSRLSTVLSLVPGIGGIPATPGEHNVDLRDALRDHPALARLGVNFVDVEPAIIRVRLDQLASRSVEVRAVLPGLDVQGAATAAPPKVTLRLLERDVANLPPVLAATATPDADVLARLAGEGPHTVPGRVSVPGLPAWLGPVTIDPPEVLVTFTLRSKIDAWSVPQAPIWVVLPPGEAASWSVTPAQAFVENVSITGPRELIEQVRAVEGGVRAYVVLSSDDLQKRVTSAPITFSLAPTGLRFTAKQSSVGLKIERR